MREFKPLLWPHPYKRICYVPGELAFELEGFKIKVASLPRFKILGFSSGRRGLRVVNSTPDLYSTPESGAPRVLDLPAPSTGLNESLLRFGIVKIPLAHFASL